MQMKAIKLFVYRLVPKELSCALRCVAAFLRRSTTTAESSMLFAFDLETVPRVSNFAMIASRFFAFCVDSSISLCTTVAATFIFALASPMFTPMIDESLDRLCTF